MPDQSATPLRDGETIEAPGIAATVRTSRRRRLAVSVETDGTVYLRAPFEQDRHSAVSFLREHTPWIIRKQRARSHYAPVVPEKQLIDGEGFQLLGRNHALRLVGEQDSPGQRAMFAHERLLLPRRLVADPALARTEIIELYRLVGREWLTRGYHPWAARIGIPDPPVAVRDLGRRWGSFVPTTGRVLLHWAVFQLPSPLIDYVLAHEQVHAVVPDHGRRFQETLNTAMPDWRERKRQLDQLARALWFGDLGAG